MPVKSKAQTAFLGIHRPDVLRKWKAEGAKTSAKGLPQKVTPIDVAKQKVRVRIP